MTAPVPPRRPQGRLAPHRLVLSRLTRRPLAYWAAALVLAAATGSTVLSLVSDAEAARARYGDARPVLVATRDLPAGHVLTPGDTEVRLRPRTLTPAAALAEPADGVALRSAVFRGEPLVAGRLAGAGTGPVAARLPPGTRGVAVPGVAGLRLHVGDTVDVLATFDPGTAGDDAEPTFPVARHATVVDVGDDVVTVAVAAADVARVAFALTAGVVTVVLSGPA